MQKDVIFSEDKDSLTVFIHSDVDHHSARSMREQIDRRLFESRPRVLVIDFSGVEFMDSSGLGLILGRAALCEEMGVTLHLLHPGARVKRIFAVAGIDRLRHITIEE